MSDFIDYEVCRDHAFLVTERRLHHHLAPSDRSDGNSGVWVSKRVLLIAFHYPPMSRSSGAHRTRKFAQYLAEFGWEPLVLTVQSGAYPENNLSSFTDPPGVIVKRAFGLDTARQLAIAGRYFKFMALPDRWASWWFGAVPSGLALIRRYRPRVIFSTYPLATAHMIGLALHKLSGLPWVADFRDPMTALGYPHDLTTRRIYQWIERKTVHHCAHAVFTTPETCSMYAQRYPDIPADRWSIIANGYDEESFVDGERQSQLFKRGSGPRVLVHSGVVYRWERDPEPFFSALAELRRSRHIAPQSLRIVLRACGEEKYYQQRLVELGIADIVDLPPAVSYRDALCEMLNADGLLLLQAAPCNRQIPAKAYEYLRARRPVFALIDHRGSTATLLRESGIDTIVDITDKDQIKAGLLRFLHLLAQEKAPIASDQVVAAHSRHARSGELAQLLDRVAEKNFKP